MADLTGTTPAATYKGLLQVNDYTDGIASNTGSNALVIQDGAGNATALAISTDSVGIGTTSPDGPLDITSPASPTIFFNESTNPYQARIGVPSLTGNVFSNSAIVGSLAIRNDTAIQLGASTPAVTIKDGNVGIGTASFGTNAAGVIGIGNGTAPTSSPADMVQLYARDDAGSSKLYVRNEAGTETVLSPHAADAPSSLYDRPPGVEEMHRSANYYLGTIVFTNVDRRNALMQKQLNGEELPEDRTFTITETFAEYNARTGADLQVEDWDANQQAMFDADESYVKKPKPDWLS